MAVKSSKSAQRVLTVLELIAEHQPVGAGTLAELLAEDRSAIHRAVATLADAGWIQRTAPDATAWELTGRIQVVAGKAQQRTGLVDRVRPLLQRLRSETGETTLLAAPDSGRVLILEVLESPHVMRIAPQMGTALSPSTSSAGQAILAFMRPAEREAFLGRAPSRSLIKELETVGERGWSMLDDRDGWSSVGAPVLRSDGSVLGAVVIAGPSSRLPRRRLTSFGQLLATLTPEV